MPARTFLSAALFAAVLATAPVARAAPSPAHAPPVLPHPAASTAASEPPPVGPLLDKLREMAASPAVLLAVEAVALMLIPLPLPGL